MGVYRSSRLWRRRPLRDRCRPEADPQPSRWEWVFMPEAVRKPFCGPSGRKIDSNGTPHPHQRFAQAAPSILLLRANNHFERFHICGRLHERKRNLQVCIARSQVLTSVRPLMRPIICRGPVWEFADRIQITATRSRRSVKNWLADPVSHRLCAILSFRPPYASDASLRRCITPPRPEPGKPLL
jgi:hypothetical protein